MEIAPAKKEDYVFKIVIAGSSGSGKSAISRRYFQNEFTEALGFTIGVEFDEKVVQIDDSAVKVQLWDCSGKSTYSEIAKKHFYGAVGAIIVYDVTDRNSFKDIATWREEIQREAAESCEFMVMPNKCDFTVKYPRMKQIPNEEGRKLSEEQGMMFSGECSAKKNTNVKESIDAFIVHIYNKQIEMADQKITKSKKKKLANLDDWLKHAPEERKRMEQHSSCIIF
ncbi:unnamed protein product [Moneuplotes crassus]|uniref:Uncharacterized protein n=1 Tax=Euplotes crassus TaxID=5936 RepID=A0AAD1XST7_EUPCR|nr:unnamed protein product [Moneuplotes crassus]